MKFRAIIQQEIEVEAKDREMAKKLLRENEPWIGIQGDSYFIESVPDKSKVISLKQQ